jgi:hypothetical protein
MANRTVTDTAGRTWICETTAPAVASDMAMGRDIVLSCATPSVSEPVKLTVGWQWETMSPSGLARLLTKASPVPKAV